MQQPIVCQFANDVCCVVFHNITWPNEFNGPNSFDRMIRKCFMLDSHNEPFPTNDLKDIFIAYLQDEFKVCPIDLQFEIMIA